MAYGDNYYKAAKGFDFKKNNNWKIPLLKKYKDKKVLDIGCGDGRLLKMFTKWYGIDVHKDSYKSPRVKIASIDDIPFKDEYFGAIIISHVIEHLKLETALKGLAEVRRVLKKDGEVLVFMPLPSHKSFYNCYTHQLPLTPIGMKSLFEDHGFSTFDIGYCKLRKLPFKYQEKITTYIPWVLSEAYGVFIKK